MPMVRPQAHCLSPNAFNPRHAIYGIFQHAIIPLNSHHLHSSSFSRQELSSVEQSRLNRSNSTFINESEIAIEPTLIQPPHAPGSRLLDTLRAIRNRNRNKLVRKIKHGESEESPIAADLSAKEKKQIEQDNLRVRYLNTIEPNKTIRPLNIRSYQGAKQFTSPFREFKEGKPVFSDLKFRGDVDVAHIVARDTSILPDKSVLDYEGHVVDPLVSFKGGDLPQQRPWLEGLDSLKGPAGLENEINKFHEYARPSKEESEARRHVAEEVKSIVQNFSSQKFRKVYTAELFGSATHGTSLGTSDIDIRLVDRRIQSAQWAPNMVYRKRIEKVLWALRHEFGLSGFEDEKVVHARYPLISMVHKESKIKVQVVASNADDKQKTLIRSWISKDPQILPIFSTVKSALQIRGLTDVFHGGLSSYPLLLLIRASMKLRPATALADNFLNFFRFFSEFDSYHKAIGPEPFPRVYSKVTDPNLIPALQYPNTSDERYVHALMELSVANMDMPFLLCVQDPTDKHNDVGRKTYAWKHIVETIKFLNVDLEKKLEESQSGSGLNSMLDTLVGSYHEAFGQSRIPVMQFGSKVLADPDFKPAVRLVRTHKKKRARKSATPTVVTVGQSRPNTTTNAAVLQSGTAVEEIKENSATKQNQPSENCSPGAESDEHFVSPFNLSNDNISSAETTRIVEAPATSSMGLSSYINQQTRQFHSSVRRSGLSYATFSSSSKIMPPTGSFGSQRHYRNHNYSRGRLYSTSGTRFSPKFDFPDIPDTKTPLKSELKWDLPEQEAPRKGTFNQPSNTQLEGLTKKSKSAIISTEPDTDISSFASKWQEKFRPQAQNQREEMKQPMDTGLPPLHTSENELEEWPGLFGDSDYFNGSRIVDKKETWEAGTNTPRFRAHWKLGRRDVVMRDDSVCLEERIEDWMELLPRVPAESEEPVDEGGYAWLVGRDEQPVDASVKPREPAKKKDLVRRTLFR